MLDSCSEFLAQPVVVGRLLLAKIIGFWHVFLLNSVIVCFAHGMWSSTSSSSGSMLWNIILNRKDGVVGIFGCAAWAFSPTACYFVSCSELTDVPFLIFETHPNEQKKIYVHKQDPGPRGSVFCTNFPGGPRCCARLADPFLMYSSYFW